MPNWCEGPIKIRGKYENVKKFLTEGVNIYKDTWNGEERISEAVPREKWLAIEEGVKNNVTNIFRHYNEPDLYTNDWVYIEETKRAFITDFDIDLDKDDDPVVAVANFAQAWGIRPEEFAKLAEKYEVDFRLYGIDGSMGFFEEYEILDNGKTINDLGPKNWLSYSEFKWLCPFPFMGG